LRKKSFKRATSERIFVPGNNMKHFSKTWLQSPHHSSNWKKADRSTAILAPINSPETGYSTQYIIKAGPSSLRTATITNRTQSSQKCEDKRAAKENSFKKLSSSLREKLPTDDRPSHMP
jgi:hypothetical protein